MNEAEALVLYDVIELIESRLMLFEVGIEGLFISDLGYAS